MVRLENKYIAIKSLHEQKQYPISTLCNILELNRSSYYKWLRRDAEAEKAKNDTLVNHISTLYEEYNGILGYRRMKIYLQRRFGLTINKKRVYRIMKVMGLKSVIRRKRPSYIKSTPEITADNILNRNFVANSFNEKWLTDVTEFKYNGGKAYLSAILDLKDNSIIAYAMGHSNNNKLVFDTFDAAINKYPDAKPLFHSDRGFQYTNKTFKSKLDAQGITQSMSRVGRCIDNGPMEAFWGTLKAEMYYLRKFDSYDELVQAVVDYINFYNNFRFQERLDGLAPAEFRAISIAS